MNGTDTKTPPRYAPDAVATNLGWMNPRTGELLVSANNLDNPIDLRGYPRREYVFAIHAALRERAQVQDNTPEVEVQTDPVVETPKDPEVVVSDPQKDQTETSQPPQGDEIVKTDTSAPVKKTAKKKVAKNAAKKSPKKTKASVKKEKTSR